MSYFVINKCEVRACLHWRVTNECAKNGRSIEIALKWAASLHNSKICLARKQIDQFRLEQMLEK
jgi:hypothetical protein